MIKIYKSRQSKNKVWIRVSKKVSKKAVVRNKVKRRIRAVLQEVNEDLTPYVISALPGADQIEFSELRQILLKRIKRELALEKLKAKGPMPTSVMATAQAPIEDIK